MATFISARYRIRKKTKPTQEEDDTARNMHKQAENDTPQDVHKRDKDEENRHEEQLTVRTPAAEEAPEEETKTKKWRFRIRKKTPEEQVEKDRVRKTAERLGK